MQVCFLQTEKISATEVMERWVDGWMDAPFLQKAHQEETEVMDGWMVAPFLLDTMPPDQLGCSL